MVVCGASADEEVGVLAKAPSALEEEEGAKVEEELEEGLLLLQPAQEEEEVEACLLLLQPAQEKEALVEEGQPPQQEEEALVEEGQPQEEEEALVEEGQPPQEEEELLQEGEELLQEEWPPPLPHPIRGRAAAALPPRPFSPDLHLRRSCSI